MMMYKILHIPSAKYVGVTGYSVTTFSTEADALNFASGIKAVTIREDKVLPYELHGEKADTRPASLFHFEIMSFDETISFRRKASSYV